MSEDRRAITITWDPDALAEPDVALGPGVSAPEAHHVLAAAAEALEYICPVPRVTKAGVMLSPELVEVIDDDDGEDA